MSGSSLWQCFLHYIICPNSLKNLQLHFIFDSHSGKFLTLSKDSRNLLSGHIFIDEFSEDFPIVNIDASNVFLVLSDLIQKVARDQEDNYNEEND